MNRALDAVNAEQNEEPQIVGERHCPSRQIVGNAFFFLQNLCFYLNVAMKMKRASMNIG
jgi:hypothetical protein